MNGDGVRAITELAKLALGAEIVTLHAPGISADVAMLPGKDGVIEAKSVKALIDEWRTAPERRKGAARIDTLASFSAFVTRQKDADSVLFADVFGAAPSLTAIFDYHKIDGSPRFGDDRARYAFPLSPEWQAWKAADGKAMAQAEWAAFIEDHIAELASPLDAERSEFERLFQTKIAVPSELIQLSRGMQVSVEARVKNVQTLQSGEVEIVYEEVHKDGSGEKLVVPGLFVVGVPLFAGGEAQRLIARLRYRRKDNAIVWFYQLYRAADVVREAMRRDAESVAAETALPLFEGAAG